MNLGLYITFVLVGLVLFGFVYLYSVREQKKRRKVADRQIDALVDHEPITAGFDGASNFDSVSKPNLKPEVRQPQKNAVSQHSQSATRAKKQQATPVRKAPHSGKPEVRPLSKTQPSRRTIALDEEDSRAISVPDLSEPYSGEEHALGVANERNNSTFSDGGLHDATGSAPVEKNDRVEGYSYESEADFLSTSFNAEEANPGVSYEASVGQNSQASSERKEPSLPKTEFLTEQHSDDESTEEASVELNEVVRKKVSELVAKIPGDAPANRDEVLALFRKYDYLLARKIQVFGIDTLTDVWTDLELDGDDSKYSDLAVSVQLADKTGALTRKELNAMSQLVLELSDMLDRKFSFSMDLDDAIEKGRELDRIARTHCAMVVLNIVPKRRSGFRSSDFESCSRDLTMTQAENGVFTRFRRKGAAEPVAEYNIAVADDKGKFRSVTKQQPFYINDIVVYLNVPRVGDPLEVFDNMLEESRRLATWLDGKLVDKQRRNLTTKMVRQFRDQIAEIQTAMKADGLEPGDELSQKLF